MLYLNLVTSVVITWNTVYMAQALDSLRSEGFSVSDEDLVHLAPTLRATSTRTASTASTSKAA